MVEPHADADGPRRHVRPARRRLPPLLGRRPAGWCRTSRRCSTTTPSSPRSTCTPGSPPASRSTAASREETLDYVLREMTDPSGGFYSAQDADSEGVEGKFFVWSRRGDRAVLGDADDDARRARLLGRRRRAQLRGPQHPLRPARAGEVAADLGLHEADSSELIGRARARLYAVREHARAPRARRQGARRPGTGSCCAAFAEAGRVLGRADYLAAAVEATPSSSSGRCARRPAAAHLEGRPGQAQRLPRGLRHGGRGPARPLRGDLRPPLARRVAPARRGDAAACSGTRARRLLRHGRSTTRR